MILDSYSNYIKSDENYSESDWNPTLNQPWLRPTLWLTLREPPGLSQADLFGPCPGQGRPSGWMPGDGRHALMNLCSKDSKG